LYNIKKSG